MRKIVAFLLSFLFALPLFAQEGGGDYGPKKYICTVGGEAFEQYTDLMFFPLQGLPNGSHPGGDFSDIMVPECPVNGLVMVPRHDGEADDPQAMTAYTLEDLAKLPALIASSEYKAMLKEARFYRLYWIAGKLGRPAMQRFHLVQHVSWLRRTPEEHRRYLEFFVKEVDPLMAAKDFDPAFRTKARLFAANALRELGRFDEARARLEVLQREQIVLLDARAKEAPPEDPDFESGMRGDDGFLWHVSEQLKAIDDKNDDMFPVSMMGSKWANAVCRNVDDDYPLATQKTKDDCARRKAEQEQESRESAEYSKLLSDKAELVRLCRTTPPQQRKGQLQEACESEERMAEYDKRQAEAEKLLKNPKVLDAQCKGKAIPRYAFTKTALGVACQHRADDLREREAGALATKMRKQPAEFVRLCSKFDYPQSGSDDPVEVACNQIDSERDSAQDDRERARLEKMSEAQIRAECAQTGNREKRLYPLHSKCVDLKQADEDAQWAALEKDPVKLEAECAKEFKAHAEWIAMRCYDRERAQTDEAALQLARDHGKLVAACATTPMPQRDAILRAACESYRKCVIVRQDELPYSRARSRISVIGSDEDRPDPAELVPACYDSSEEANTAAALYAANPKALRAECKPDPDAYWDDREAIMCAAYAKGEDIFAAQAEGDTSRAMGSGTDCDFDKAGRSKPGKVKYRSAVDAAAAAAKCAAQDAKETR